METKLPRGAPEFLAAVQDGLAAGFGWLKAEADASMQRDVFNFLHARPSCESILEFLVQPPAVDMPPRDRAMQLATRGRTELAEPGTFDPLRALTWNVSMDNKAWKAPVDDKDWNAQDKRAALEREILDLRPQVVALQECPSQEPWQTLQERYTFLGSAKSHSGYVHVYALKSLGAQALPSPPGLPAVINSLDLGR